VATQFDVIIIGGGPAGYVCAIRAAQLGLATALVERDKLGGVCVNIGCIPTKALLHSAYVANLVAHDAKELGVEVSGVKADYGVAMRRSRKVSEQNSKGVEFLMKKHKITVIRGTGVLGKNRTLKVGSDEYQARKAVVIATGSRVKGIPQIGLEINKTSVISSDEALFLEQVPKSIAVIGAGAVGCEFTDIFNAFGTKVTLIEALPRILPLEDAEASDALAKSFKKRGITTVAGAKVTKATVAADKVTLEFEAGGKKETLEVEKVLMAAGRAVNTESMGFQEAGVQLNERGFVKVNLATLETTAAGIYCIGDVAGPPMLAHKGEHEGVVCVEAIKGLNPHPLDKLRISGCTYCNPQVASVGLTEAAAKAQNREIKVGRFPFAGNGKAIALGEDQGLVKTIFDAKTGQLLGAHMVGAEVTELIQGFVIAMQLETTEEDLMHAVFPHPTLSEMMHESVLDAFGRAIHI